MNELTTKPPVVEVKVNFSAQAYQTLQRLAACNGTTMAHELAQAIGMKSWLDDRRREGDRLLLEHRNGKLDEVTFRY